MIKVLVLDTNQRSALAVTRSLGKLPDVTILGADSTIDSLAGSSKYCARYLQAPSSTDTPGQFLNWLKDLLDSETIDFVFPVTEVTSQLLLMNPEIITPKKLPFAAYDTIMALADKGELVSLAQSLGVITPDSTRFDRASEVELATLTTFPLVIKPCLSRIWTNGRWLHTAVHIAHSAEELADHLRNTPWLQDHPFMLQAFIPGHGAGVFAIYDRGQPIAFFAHKRLREKPPQGGVSVLSESAPLSPSLQAAAEKLLNAVTWHGVAMVEFRVAEDGTPYLMEVNTRFWGSLQLAIDAGVDFPALLLAISQGKSVKPVTNYKLGTRLRWVMGDLDSLYLVLKSPHYSVSFKLGRLLAFLTPHPFKTRHEVNRWGDFGPAITEVKEYLRALRGS